jgi:sugar lactone lactonase YvrE
MRTLHALDTTTSLGTGSTLLRRLAMFGLALALGACGGSADAPPPPESVPTAVTQPADQSVVEGTAATFTVTAAGAAPLAYQWLSSTDGVNFTAIDGATSASFSTGATTLAQNGTHYRVVVSNGLGSVTSSAATLTVTPAVVAPAIVAQPADQAVVAPASATFNVTATGTSLSYDWQVSTDGGTTFTDVVGAPDAPSLTVANSAVGQSGQRYRVQVSNSAGSVTSNPALLMVTAATTAPAFTTQPASQTIAVGQSASFTVVATGTPAPTVAWRLGGSNLADGLLTSGACAGATVTGSTSATLTLANVPLGCSGAVFSAVARNGVAPDAVSNSATLTVNPVATAPSVTLQPVDVTVLAPATATFTAAASGAPMPTVQWQLSIDGGQTWANINGATSPIYTTPATAAGDNQKRFRAVFSNASGSATTNAATLTVATTTFHFMNGIAVDGAGNIYVSDGIAGVIRKIPPAGAPTTLAGTIGTVGSNDGNGAAARFFNPFEIALDPAGDLYVADSQNNTIRKITPAGDVTTLAGTAGASTVDVDGVGSAARFVRPLGVSVGPTGDLFVGDSVACTIRRVTAAGAVTTVAGLSNVCGTTDGVASAARFGVPIGTAVDAQGNIYVADEGNGLINSTIRKITPAGTVSTFAGLANNPGSADGTGSAARFATPFSVAVDGAGNVYVADTGNHTIRKITPAAVVTTLAGLAGSIGYVDGTGSAARFNTPTAIAVDAAGNVFVTDRSNSVVRKITPAGVVTSIFP